MNRFAILFAAGLAATACSPDASTTALACQQGLTQETGYDLVLTGSGACPGRIALTVRAATGDPTSPAWTDSGIEVQGKWRLTPAGALREVTLYNASNTNITVAGLEWSTGNDGLSLEADRLLNNGYQSWSYTGILPIPEKVPEANGTADHGGDDEDVTAEIHGISWWWTALSDGSGTGLVAGFDGAATFKSYIAADRPAGVRLRMIMGLTGDSIVLAPGESKKLDGLYVAFGDLNLRLDDYAARVAALHPPAQPLQRPLGGWGSWNVYYEHPTADLLRQDMAWAKERLLDLGLTDFLLDDGYENRWGEWSASVTFGAELAVLNDEQEAIGLRPAIWLAPFYVNIESHIVRDHPAWFVKRPDGSLRTYDNVGTVHAALDVTHPDARAFVVQTVQQYRAWGYRTLKIDFLFGAGITGLRTKTLTGMESYALWMKTLREAVPDLHLVGCGAPLLPSVGWVDSMRTGPDIAFNAIPEPRYAFYAGQSRNNARRAFTDAWWAIDPDVILLRGTDLSDAEAWSAIVAGAMAGGNYLMGDGRQAQELRQTWALDPLLLTLTRDGISAIPIALDADMDEQLMPVAFDVSGKSAIPHVWRKRAADGRNWLAVFGWGDDFAVETTFPDNAKEYIPALKPWGNPTLRPISGPRRISVEQRSVRLFTW